MNTRHRIRLALFGVALGICAISTCVAAPGQLPLGYRIAAGAYPWTGRLLALGFNTASHASTAVLTEWEAGERLNQRNNSTRRLYVGGARLDALQWSAIDADTQSLLDGIEPAGEGRTRLAWLRGNLGDAALRPRDTRLGSASGARVLMVSPPMWIPMQPGHTDFRQRHASRPFNVWLGTRDGLLHGFDALSGDEIAGYLPHAMVAAAAAMTSPDEPIPLSPPCPRPESVDADPSGIWRTLLLCGIPARETSTASQAGAVFVLDISDPDAGVTPFELVWEVSATDGLPLTGQGQIRAAMWIEHAVRRWAAVAMLAPNVEAGTRAEMALLPLDRPAHAWASSGAIERVGLPESGCDAPTVTTRLLSATVNSDAGGVARAVYVVDNSGRLWRFPLGHLSDATAAKPPTCMHRHEDVSGGEAESPIVIQTGTGPLVVYGAGNSLSAIPDVPGRTAPTPINALPSGDGFVLRAAQASATPSRNGWTLVLPHPGEQIDTLQSASAVHLGFTTIAPDGQRRSYLIDATTGESVTTLDANGAPSPAITGLVFDGDMAPIVVTTTATGEPTESGKASRDTVNVDVWQIDGNTARLTQKARWYRRRGRIGWREIMRIPS